MKASTVQACPVCVLATTRELQDGDFRLARTLSALGDSVDVTVWAVEGLADQGTSSTPGVRFVSSPEGDALLLIQTPEALGAFFAANATCERVLIWMEFESLRSSFPSQLYQPTIQHLRTSLAVCALNEADANAWAEALGRRPAVIDVAALDRRRMRTAEPLIEQGSVPRIMMDLNGSVLDARTIEAYLALDGEACEIWHVHAGELRPWMRPDMQFLAIAARDRGLFYQAVDAAFVDESMRGAADKIKDYLAAGVAPIPLAQGGLCQPSLLALGMHPVAAEGSLKARVRAWLAAASRPDLRMQIAAYAEDQGYLTAEDETLALALAGAHAEQKIALVDLGGRTADTKHRQVALDLAGRPWKRWEAARPSLKAQGSNRMAVSVTGWATEGDSDLPCELLLISANASARLARSSRMNSADACRSGGGGAVQSVFRAAGLLPDLSLGGTRGDVADGAPGALTVVAVGSRSGAAIALPSSSAGGGGGPHAVARALSRRAAGQQPTAQIISGGLDNITLAPIRAVSIHSRDVEPGQTFVRAFDDDGDPIVSDLWLSLEGIQHCGLVLLDETQNEGLRSIGEELGEAVGRAIRLTLWSETVSVSSVHVYNPE